MNRLGWTTLLALAAALVGFWACDDIRYGDQEDPLGSGTPAGDDDAGDDVADDDAGDDTAGESPTWENFAQQFMADYCTRCHGDPPSGGAPYPLVTYDQVVARSAKVKTTVVSLSMPPSSPRPTQEEINTLAAWIDAGAPEG